MGTRKHKYYKASKRITPNSRRSKDKRMRMNRPGYKTQKQLKLEEEARWKEIVEASSLHSSQDLKNEESIEEKLIEEFEVKLIEESFEEKFIEECIKEKFIVESFEEKLTEELSVEDFNEESDDDFVSFNQPPTGVLRVYGRTPSAHPTPRSFYEAPQISSSFSIADVAKQFPNLSKLGEDSLARKRLAIKRCPKPVATNVLDVVKTEFGEGNSSSGGVEEDENAAAAAELAKLMKRQEEAEQHSLVVQPSHVAGQDPRINQLKQRRVVDVAHVITEARKLEGHECTVSPGIGSFSFLGEVRHGLHSTFSFQCFSCGMKRRFFNVPGKPDDINSACVKAMTSIGKGHEHLKQILNVFDIPAPSYGTFKKHKDRLKQINSTQENPTPDIS